MGKLQYLLMVYKFAYSIKNPNSGIIFYKMQDLRKEPVPFAETASVTMLVKDVTKELL